MGVAYILPPQTQPVTADNVTGANLTPISTCKSMTLQDQNQVDSFTVTTPNGVTTTYLPGTAIKFRAPGGQDFPQTVASGIVVKRVGVGTITFNLFEAAE